MEPQATFQVEEDSLGAIRVPAAALYGGQTQRAVDIFPVSGLRPFALPKPYTSPKDIFCLRERPTVNGYRRISLSGYQVQVPNVPLYEAVEVHMVPDIQKHAMELRLWWNQELVHNISLPMQGFSVHLSAK